MRRTIRLQRASLSVSYKDEEQGVVARNRGEVRIKNSTDDARDQNTYMVALYRHVGDNFKLGFGYNFGVFSGDMRDLTLDDKGDFLNVVGEF